MTTQNLLPMTQIDDDSARVTSCWSVDLCTVCIQLNWKTC